ncbi:MAG: pantetheine-phosphate adenylyltransferase [Myxococcota bacterium]|nr:pantetheine-phosphate adenylyltransferase [Myxococcota bacterium]
MARTAVYAGSFDPITMGHLDLVHRALTLFDEVVLAIGHNPGKRHCLPLAERERVLEEVAAELPGVRVDRFDGLLVDYCNRVGAVAILRGLRAVTDFEFEFKIGLANMDMAPQVQTVFLLSEPRNIFVSSSLVREIASHGGDVSRYLPRPAHDALMRALQEE